MSRSNQKHHRSNPAMDARHPARRHAYVRQRVLACLIGGALVAGTAAVPTTSWAQTTNATLRGKTAANTEVTALNVATGVTRKTTSDASGNYLLGGLPPGTYTISAGPGTTRTVTLSVASHVTLNLKPPKNAPAVTAKAPEAGNATELKGVQVVAGALPEIKTSQVSATVSQHQINTLPQVSRNFLEFADVVPGMKFTVSPNGNTSLSSGAQASRGMNVYIDGVSQKSYVMGASMAGQHDSQGNPFPQLAIGQYKVITSSYKAQYSQLTSAVITAVSKSGTNEFHGSAFERYTNSGYRARTPAENYANEKTPSMEREYGFSVSGPIVKNKMHFFLTYAAKRFNTPTTVVAPGDATPGVQYLPTDVAAQLGPANLPFKEDQYFAKLDYEPNGNNRLVLTGSFRFEHSRKDVGGLTAASAGVDNNHISRRYMFKWDHSGSVGFNELMVTHQTSFYKPTPLHFGNGKTYTWDIGPKDVPIIVTGAASPLSAQNKGQKGWTFKDDFTLNPIEWHGTHVIRMGVVYRDLTLKAADAANVNPNFTYNVTPNGVAPTPYKAFFTKPVSGLGLVPTVVTKDRQYGIYIQDDWEATDRLTLNLGIRWDYERNPSYTDFVTPANVVAALHSQNPYPGAKPGQTYAESLAAGGVDINDYISTGDNRDMFKGMIQPRLGFSYDLFGDKKHVLHGAMGRSYGHSLYNYWQLETTKAALPEYTVYFRNPATGQCRRGHTLLCFDWDPRYLNGLSNLQGLLPSTNKGAEVDLLNNNLKPPRTDKFSLGIRNIIGHWQTDATVVRTLYRGGFAFTLGNRWPDGAFYGGPNDSQPWGEPIPGFGNLIIGNNGIEIRSTQVLVSAKKPFTKQSGWGLTVAYTYTHAKQNRDISQHYSFDYPFVGDYPFITSNASAEHRLVASGSWQGPWGLMFGAKLTLATPVPWNGIGCYENHTFPNGSHCRALAGIPRSGSKFLIGGDIWGYRDVDFQVTKNFDLPYGTTLYARFDLLNAFNFNNYSDYIVDTTGGPGHTVVAYNPIGNITYVPRTIKFELGVRF